MNPRLPLCILLAGALLLTFASAASIPGQEPTQGKKTGPPETQGGMLQDPMSHPGIANSGGVDPLTPEQLQAFIPAKLAGMARSEMKGESGQLGPGKMSFAYASFYTNEERHLQLDLFDRGGFPSNTHRPLPVPGNGESVKHLNYTVTGVEVAGFPAAQMQEGPARKLQVTAGRVRITLFAVGVEFSELAQAAASLPLAEIARKAPPRPETPEAPPKE